MGAFIRACFVCSCLVFCCFVAAAFELDHEALLQSPTMHRVQTVVDALSGRIDEFERQHIDERLISFQQRFDESASEVIQAEELLHEKIARAEHALQELVEEMRNRGTGSFPIWIIPAVLVSAATVGLVALRLMTQKVVRRANSEPVLGGFSPISGKQKKAW